MRMAITKTAGAITYQEGLLLTAWLMLRPYLIDSIDIRKVTRRVWLSYTEVALKWTPQRCTNSKSCNPLHKLQTARVTVFPDSINPKTIGTRIQCAMFSTLRSSLHSSKDRPALASERSFMRNEQSSLLKLSTISNRIGNTHINLQEGDDLPL